MSSQPCRALILVTIADGSKKRVSVPGTGYGIERHIDRWRARGATRIYVALWSTSTGRQIDSGTWG